MTKRGPGKTAEPSAATFTARPNAGVLQRQHSFGPTLAVQREATGPLVHPAAPDLVRNVLESPGQPLDSKTRSDMEPRFGYDFSSVRVHTDDAAAASAKAVNANAYTAGNHVAFADGRFAPGSPSGQRLLTHELTHVVQQATGPVASTPVADGLSISDPHDPFEREARSTSTRSARDATTARDRSLESLNAKPAGQHSTIQRADSDLSKLDSQTSFGIGAVSGISSIATGIWSGITAQKALGVSRDQLAEAKEQNRIGKEALDTSEAQPTAAEGLSITHAAIPDFHPDDKAPKNNEILVPLLQVGVAGEDMAAYRVRLQIGGKNHIRGGTTEEADADGYIGGFGGSNVSITFTATAEPSSAGDTLLIQFRGTNIAGKRKGVQRIHGEIKIHAEKWDREVVQFTSHPTDRNTKQATGPWAMVPPYQPPTPQADPAPAPKKSAQSQKAPKS